MPRDSDSLEERLSGRPIPPGTAFVTGAGKRIGRHLALSLAHDGWAVAVHYRGSREAAEAVVSEIEAGGGRACALQGDLAVEAEVKPLIARAADALGPVTCLINNASTFEDDRVDDPEKAMTRESWDAHIEPNLRAPLVLTQEMARRLPAEANGLVVNFLDQRVWKLTPQFLSYTVSKSALWTLTRTLAQALAPRIRVNGIGPGPTLRNPRQGEEDFAKQVAATPLQVVPHLDEMAAAIRFLLASPSVTGQMIALDAGQHLAWETPDVTGLAE